MGNLYERLETLCKAKGITRAQMCRDTGISSGNVTDLKMGRKETFSVKTMTRLARYFNVPIAYLSGDTDDPNPTAATAGLFLNENKPDYLRLIEEGYTGTAFSNKKSTVTLTSDDFDELADIWNTLKDRPEMKMLFKSAKRVTKEQILLTAQMFDSFKRTEKGNEEEWED